MRLDKDLLEEGLPYGVSLERRPDWMRWRRDGWTNEGGPDDDDDGEEEEEGV
jgi:hypothetical protein